MGDTGWKIKDKFREFLHGKHRERELHFYLASSSGKAIGEQVPSLIGKRAAWASKQGAPFIELAVENPSMILSDMEELVNSAKQMGISYSAHSSTQIAFGASYMRRSQGGGFNPAQDYHRNLIIACGKLKEKLHRETEEDFTSINAHATIHKVPPEEERLASDVSLGPFGKQMRESDIFESAEARYHIWKGFIKDLAEHDQSVFGSVLSTLEFQSFFADRHREKIVDRLVDEGYLPEDPEEFQEVLGPRAPSSYETLDAQTVRRLAQIELPDYPALDAEYGREVDQELKEEAKEEVYEKIGETIKDDRDSIEKIANMRGLTDEFNKESSVFRKILPRWMPHAEQKPIRQLWEDITGLSSGVDADKSEDEIEDLSNEYRGEKKMVAAATAAIVWGHLTQIEGSAPGVEDMGEDSTLAEILDHYDIQLCFEAHMGGAAEDLRLWVPADRLAMCRAVNNTEIKGSKHDVCRLTIDMEHLATQKIDPLWVINGNKDQKLKGLEKGDGNMIRTIHVTHPYIAESRAGHEHGPIRRGDTLVYKYIYNLVDRGFAQSPEEPAIIMYEFGGEQAESVYNLRLILDMIEAGIIPKDLEVMDFDSFMGKEPENLRERLLQEFFGVSEQEMRHEWQSIHEHALDPLEGMLEGAKGTHTWEGRGALEGGSRPEEWQKEQYR